MNYNLFRFTGVFTAAIVGIFVLIAFEGILTLLIAEVGYLWPTKGMFTSLYIVAIWVKPFWLAYFHFILGFELAAFAVAAYVEGYFYAKRRTVRPSSFHLLTASTSMAIVGLMICFFTIVLIPLTMGVQFPFGTIRVTTNDAFYLVLAIVTCAIICRFFLGWGLRKTPDSEFKLSSENP